MKDFPQFVMTHTVKGFGIVNETEVDVFLEFFCFFYDPMDLGNLIFDSSDFSKFSLYIWKFLVHILMKSSLRILSRLEVFYFLMKFYLVFSFGMYFSVSSFLLILCVCFYVLGKTTPFLCLFFW